jgi:hypothetical protein
MHDRFTNDSNDYNNHLFLPSYADERTKTCPLCNAANAPSNKECHICGWHGVFEDLPADPVLDACPELDQALLMLEEREAKKTVRFHEFMRKIFWPVD